jgi:hypothetical protein
VKLGQVRIYFREVRMDRFFFFFFGVFHSVVALTFVSQSESQREFMI